ncbi:MAG: hypothetical protein RPT95_13800 [Candidatus Sedimenticola sp. (ex Thyasira tokunagai)]
MGKATITARNAGAEYDVTIKYDGTYITKKVAKINTRLNEINSVDLPAAQATLTAAETDESVARANYDVAITAFAANPLQLGLREVVEEKKKAWHDSLRPLHLARDAAARIKAERLSLDKHKGWLNSKDMADKTATIWCADLSDGETGRREITSAIDVGTIELFDGDEVLHTIIRPGYAADPLYSLTNDGLISGVANNPAAGWFYNAAINPAWQQYMPKYRAGTITSFDNLTHAATVKLDEVRIAKTGKAAPLQILSGVPVSYMDCDHWAFDLNDRVVVEFSGQRTNSIPQSFSSEVALTNDNTGVAGNAAITKTGANIIVTGMTGGTESTKATGTVSLSGMPLDGDTITLNDGSNTATVFEFDNDSSVIGGNVPVAVGSNIKSALTALMYAINGVHDTLLISAVNGGMSVIGFIDNPKYCDPGEFWCYPRSDECIAGWGTPFTPLPGTCGTSSPRRKFRRPADDWEQQTFDTDQYIGHVDWRNGNGVTLSWYWSGKSRYEWSWSLAQHVYYNGAQYATVPDAGYGVLGACIKTISSVDKLYIVGYNGFEIRVYQTDFDSPGTYVTKLILDLETLYQPHANGQIRSTPIYFSESGSEAQFTFTPAYLITPAAIDGTDYDTGQPFHTFTSVGMGGCSVKLMKLNIDVAGDVTNTLMTNTMPSVSVVGDYTFTGTYPPETVEDFHYKTSASGQFIVAADYVGETIIYAYMDVDLLNEVTFHQTKTSEDLQGCQGVGAHTTDYWTEELLQKVLVTLSFNDTVIKLQNVDGRYAEILDQEWFECSDPPRDVFSKIKDMWRGPWAEGGDRIHRSLIGLDLRTGKYATITKHFVTNEPSAAYLHLHITEADEFAPPEWDDPQQTLMELKETIEYMGVELWASDELKVEGDLVSQEDVGDYEWWFGFQYQGLASKQRKYFPLNPMRLYREWDHLPVSWKAKKWFSPTTISYWKFYNDVSHVLEDKVYTVHDTYDVLFPLDSHGLYGRDQEHDAWYMITPFYTPNSDKGFAASGSDAFLSIKTEEHESQIVSVVKYVNHLTHGDPNDIVGMEEGVNDTNARYYPICNTK